MSLYYVKSKKEKIYKLANTKGKTKMFINIGEKIKLHREEKKVSQDDFARYLGVTCKEVLKWENGELYPDFELIPTIANYFGVSTDELLCMENVRQ